MKLPGTDLFCLPQAALKFSKILKPVWKFIPVSKKGQ